MAIDGVPPSLGAGWRKSIRTGAVYRRIGEWVAIVAVRPDGYSMTLRRQEAVRTLDDALALANDLLEEMRV